MNESLQARLRRLGVVKGARELKPAPRSRAVRPSTSPANPIGLRPSIPPDIDDEPPAMLTLLPGSEIVETAVGACLVLDAVYPLVHPHGDDRLGDLLDETLASATMMTGDGRFTQLQVRDLLFLDTETTGLAGAGTLAFMVGVAFFTEEALIVRQYFLRDHADEAAMLTLLDDMAAAKKGLVTFNGRSFDLPLLDGRYLMNRMDGGMLEMPHLDLLHPSRRLWRRRLGSCALGSLEQTLLGLRRTEEDVPGWLIPGLYQDYLRSGDGRELLRVFYHNQIDMLSMVTLAQRVLRLFDRPSPADYPADLVSLGKWQADLKLLPVAEQSLRWAAAADLPLALYHEALGRLALLLKRQDRREEAVPLWQQIAATSFDSVTAHVELAKHYEWQHRDYAAAVSRTEEALGLIATWDRYRAQPVRVELEHRRQRLRKKLKEGTSNAP